MPRLPSDQELFTWFNPLGRSVRLAAGVFTFNSLKEFNWGGFRASCTWMGAGSLPFIIISAVFISFALSLQCISEMYKFKAEDLAGAVIAIGLLRELGPLTVSLAWSAKTAARVSQESIAWRANNANVASESDYARDFVLVQVLAAVCTGIPLSIYGLVIGFGSAAVSAPLFGGNSTGDFLEVARLTIRDNDVFAYFLKIGLVNPVIAALAGCAYGRNNSIVSASNAVAATFVAGYIINFVITAILFFHPT